MDEILLFVAATFGVELSTLVATVGLVVAICNLLGKAIPDSATGPLGVLRRVCKVLGLYIGNNLNRGVTTTTVARAMVATVPNDVLSDASRCLTHAVESGESSGDLASSLVNAAQGEDPELPAVAPVKDAFAKGATATRTRKPKA